MRLERDCLATRHACCDGVLAPRTRGRVTDKRDGPPLPGATVVLHSIRIFRENEIPASFAVADEQGHFMLIGLAACRYSVFVRHGMDRLEDVVELETSSGTTRDGLALRLVPGVTVCGVVRGPHGPVAGARVKAEMGWPLEETPRDETDAEGLFELAAVPRRKARLSVKDCDITAGEEVDAQRAVDGWVVEVRERPALRGRVVHHGVPVAEVTVEAETGLAVTDEEGRFALTRVPYGPVELSVRDAHRSGSLSVDYKSEMEPVTLELEDNAALSGTLLDADGTPISRRAPAMTSSSPCRRVIEESSPAYADSNLLLMPSRLTKPWASPAYLQQLAYAAGSVAP